MIITFVFPIIIYSSRISHLWSLWASFLPVPLPQMMKIRHATEPMSYTGLFHFTYWNVLLFIACTSRCFICPLMLLFLCTDIAQLLPTIVDEYLGCLQFRASANGYSVHLRTRLSVDFAFTSCEQITRGVQVLCHVVNLFDIMKNWQFVFCIGRISLIFY